METKLIPGGIYRFGIKPEHSRLVILLYQNENEIIMLDGYEYINQYTNTNKEVINQLYEFKNKNCQPNFLRFDNFKLEKVFHGYLGCIPYSLLTIIQDVLDNMEEPDRTYMLGKNMGKLWNRN